MISRLNNPVRVRFECKHLDVSGALVLFDPTVVQCSWVLPSGEEDVQTYLGSDARDNQLTRLSVGVYQAVRSMTSVGKWTACPRWEDTSGGLTLSATPTSDESVDVQPNPRNFADTAAQ